MNKIVFLSSEDKNKVSKCKIKTPKEDLKDGTLSSLAGADSQWGRRGLETSTTAPGTMEALLSPH